MTPLVKVIRHIQKIADVNIVLDTAALEEEHVPTSTDIRTIGVDGITLRSALNLILDPLNYGLHDQGRGAVDHQPPEAARDD